MYSELQTETCTNLLQLESGGGDKYEKLYGEQSLCNMTIKKH